MDEQLGRVLDALEERGELENTFILFTSDHGDMMGDQHMWATRLFREILRRDSKMNSFAIHLLIYAWPASWLKSIMDTDRQAKSAYFAYREALRAVAVNLCPDFFYGFSSENGKVAVYICNDIPDAMLCYQIEFKGKSYTQVESRQCI